MSIAVDDPVGDVDVGALDRCRALVLDARRVEGELLLALMEVDDRTSFRADGHRDVAAYGRAVHRWDPVAARSRRGLVKLSRRDGRVIDRLLAGRMGVDQAHLIGRTYEHPRIGPYVELFLDLFLEAAARLDYVDFKEQVQTWKLLLDEDGPDPEADRSLRIRPDGRRFSASMSGPAMDGVTFEALLQRFERIEFELDWANCRAEHGEAAAEHLLGRTAEQRRYDAFQHLLQHVVVPAGARSADDDGDVDADDDETQPDGARQAGPVRSGTRTVVNVVADADTWLAAMARLIGFHDDRPFPTPFGPHRARSHGPGGVFVDPIDIAKATIAGRIRFLLQAPDGKFVRLTQTTRLFHGPLADTKRAMSTRCSHPGCLVRTRLGLEHDEPHSHGGATSSDNCSGGVCDHHGNWRYTSGATVRQRSDGRVTTHRPDGTDIAPPD